MIGRWSQVAVREPLRALDGKRHYGDGLYKRAAEITGQTAGTLMSYASMSSAFEFSLRRENLCYGHHKEVQGLKQIATDDDGKLALSDEADQEIAELLAEAEKPGRGTDSRRRRRHGRGRDKRKGLRNVGSE